MNLLFTEENMIRHAIEQLRIIRFCYNGDANFIAVDPYALYVSKSGKTMLLAVQIADGSKIIQDPKAQEFSLSLISNLMISEKSFIADPKYSKENVISSLKIIASV